MANNEKILGRGLKELFNENDVNIDEIKDGEVIVEVSLDIIKPNPFQPRKVFNEEKISDLAKSIKEHGVFQPIILKAVNDGYIIVSGERRFRASKKAGLKTIPAIIRQYDQTKVAEIALLENLQREDLSPIEEALAYKHIIDLFSYTQRDLATRIGKSRSYITNVLGLLNLPEDVQTLILDGKLSTGHAKVLSKLEDEKRIIEIANHVVEKGLSVRDIEELCKTEKKTKQIKNTPRNKEYQQLERVIGKKYGCHVKYDGKKLAIRFDDEEQMDKVIEKLLG